MKKSSSVPATLVATIAAISLTGCGSNRSCQDAMGRVIPNQECVKADAGRPSALYTYPHWVYRRSGGVGMPLRPGGGWGTSGTTSSGGGSSATHGSTTRGGFGGSSSSSHSMGG